MKTLPLDEALARALLAGPRDRSSLDAAAALIAAGHGEQLFDALLDTRRDADGVIHDGTITDTMTSLEAMMTGRPDVAGYLMARLSPVASGRYLHHVVDAIDLHMDASASGELAESLEALSREGVRPRSQRRCLQWAAAIRGRAAVER